MALQWFRLYAEFATDPKVQMMTEAYQRRLVMMLCMRCNSDETLQDSRIAFQLRVTPDEWASTKAEFVRLGFIDEANIVLKWDKRQYKSDLSTSRVYKHRELKQKAPLQKQPRNVTVTPPEQIQNRTDTEEKQTLLSNGKFDEAAALNLVWRYYLSQTERNEKTYSFSPLRQRKGAARFTEALSVAQGNPEGATELLKIAIDAMLRSDWHMGRDPATGGKRYIEWEQHLFKSKEQLERWWQRNDEA